MPRGKPISDNDKNSILDLWLKGYTYRAIEIKIGVSISSISEFISEVLKREPELSEFRDLKVALEKADASLLECLRGAKFLERLNPFNVSLDRLNPIFKLCEAVENPVEAAEAGLEMMALTKQTGKTYQEILDEVEAKQVDLKQAEGKLEERKKDLKGTNERLEDVRSLERLQDTLRSLNLSPEKLQKFVEDAKQIERNGFTPQISVILSGEFRKLGLDPAKAAEKEANLIVQHGSMENSIASLSKEKDETEKSSMRRGQR